MVRGITKKKIGNQKTLIFFNGKLITKEEQTMAGMLSIFVYMTTIRKNALQ